MRTSPTRTTLWEAVSGVKGGVVLFRGSGAAARRYVEAGRSRADEYYLGADDAIARYAVLNARGEVTTARSLTADEYESWVDWHDPITGEQMGATCETADYREAVSRPIPRAIGGLSM